MPKPQTPKPIKGNVSIELLRGGGRERMAIINFKNILTVDFRFAAVWYRIPPISVPKEQITRMTKGEPKTAAALEVPKRARESVEREQNLQEWLQHEREQAFKRNPRLLH